MYCRNCGAQLDEGVKFCAFCGIRQIDEAGEDSSPADKPKIDGTACEASPDCGGIDGNPAPERKVVDAKKGKAKAVRGLIGEHPALFAGCIAVALLVVVVLVLVLTACPHEHWASATCTLPKTCEDCGKTEGSPLGHNWEDATCTSPKTCSRCGETTGEAKGHTLGKWEKADPDYVDATKGKVKKCTECGTAVDSKKKKITSFISHGAFSIPASDFVKRMGKSYSSIQGCTLTTESGLLADGVTMSLDVESGSEKVARAGFVEKGSKSSLLMLSMSGGEGMYWQVLFSFDDSSESTDYAKDTMYALIRTCDPSLSKKEAHKVGSKVIDNYKILSSGSGIGQFKKNGVTYSLAYSNGWMVSARVA